MAIFRFPPTLLWLVLLVVGAVTQSVTPTNATLPAGNSSDASLVIHALSFQNDWTYDLVALTSGAVASIPVDGFEGAIVPANARNELSIGAGNIALISCDPYNGFTQAGDVLTTVVGNNALAVVLYSQHADHCSLENGPSGYSPVFSMTSLNETTVMLQTLASLGITNLGMTQLLHAGQAVNETGGNNTSSSNGNPSQQQNPLGPSPSTAVAMIILYSVTGIITALFLIIIITGAVRAHRHPERYGPRGGGIGRPRQSRARGLARAMLDSLPIVKVGEREEEEKARDVELAANEHGQVEVLPEQDVRHPDEPSIAGASSAATHTGAPEGPKHLDAVAKSTDGIAPAASGAAPKPDTQGCSICTEDFQTGEDQRVLPCDHRFHPECVDPWLLNVSGTCPLCRIDLRPPPTNRASANVEDRNNSVADIDGAMPPPLEVDGGSTDPHRRSVRRSLLIGLTGVRPERLSREERVLALRELRGQQLTARRRSSQAGLAPEDESTLRRRLRNAFRVRTRRTGEDEIVQAGRQSSPPAEVDENAVQEGATGRDA